MKRLNDNDIDCMNVLARSHFLADDVLRSVPADSASAVRSSKDRWELLQKMAFIKAGNAIILLLYSKGRSGKLPRLTSKRVLWFNLCTITNHLALGQSDV